MQPDSGRQVERSAAEHNALQNWDVRQNRSDLCTMSVIPDSSTSAPASSITHDKQLRSDAQQTR